MGQKPVTYADGAATFCHLQAEAFLEIGAHSERNAIDLFEALSKTSIHLYHETLRGRTPTDIDFERNRISQSDPLSHAELTSPKFPIVAGEVSSPWRAGLLHELDATPGTNSDKFFKETVGSGDCDLWQLESAEVSDDKREGSEDGPEEAEANKSDSGSPLIWPTEPEGAEIDIGCEIKVYDSVDDLSSSLRHDVQREKATIRAPVLLRIDTELSERYRPRLIEISRPERKPGDTPSQAEPELPDWETYLQRHISQDCESRDVSFGAATELSSFERFSAYQTKSTTEDTTDNESTSLKLPNPIPQAQDSPYVLPEFPEFQPFTPKLMEIFFEEVSENARSS